MKSSTKKQPKKRLSEQELLQKEDFKWLAEIHTVLSPFWSARAGHQFRLDQNGRA